jgi:nucleoside-diphosphate-sugar epimerase
MNDSAVKCSSPLPAAARVLVLGGGYTGGRFARALDARGVAVTVSHRRPSSAEGAAAHRRRLRFDPAAGAVPTAAMLAGTTHVLVTIPPDAGGNDPVLAHLGAVMADLPLEWVGYLSTTGVYGDRGGGWVGETTPPSPSLPRSRARLACEEAWRSSGLPLQVFRLPAIYGPGRTPLASLRDGTARLIHKPGQVFSRIHVDDIVGALLHCLHLPAVERPPLLLLADEEPCPSSETLGYAAHLLGAKLPQVLRYDRIVDELSPMARSFWSESRRVDSGLLRRGLGYRLRYRSYREGYRACLGEETPPPLTGATESGRRSANGSGGAARNGTLRS